MHIENLRLKQKTYDLTQVIARAVEEQKSSDAEAEILLQELEVENRTLRSLLKIEHLYDTGMEIEVEKAFQIQEAEVLEREAEKVEMDNDRIMSMVEEILI